MNTRNIHIQEFVTDGHKQTTCFLLFKIWGFKFFVFYNMGKLCRPQTELNLHLSYLAFWTNADKDEAGGKRNTTLCCLYNK